MMHRRIARNGQRATVWAGLSGLLAAMLIWSGCDQKPPSAATPTSTASAPKGDPIRGEPIAAPAKPAPAPAPAPASAVATTPSSNPTPAVVQTPASAPAPAAPTVAKAPSTPVASPSAPSTNGTALAAAASAPTNAAPAGKGTQDSPLTLGFDRLASFQYALPDGPVDTNTVAQAGATQQIPTSIKSLNNQFVTLKGFMLPLKVEKGLVTELLIMRDQSMCCYGAVPKINEWVSVKMVGSGVKPVMDQAVTLFGKFKVGEMYENGYLVGIYAMDGEKMAGPLDM